MGNSENSENQKTPTMEKNSEQPSKHKENTTGPLCITCVMVWGRFFYDSHTSGLGSHARAPVALYSPSVRLPLLLLLLARG
jgi:hypothetical protein